MGQMPQPGGFDPIRASSIGMGLNISGIKPDESHQFMTDNEHNSIFGTGNIGPDRIRLSMAKMTGSMVSPQ